MRRVALAAAALLLLAGLGYGLVVLAAASLPRVDELARRVPARTALMKAREAEALKAGRHAAIDQRWIPYERVSPRLRHAVLIAEDDAFFQHGGLDWDQLGEAARVNLKKGRIVRGGSTITQQLAKNLYLGSERTLWRKLQEVILAGRLERALPKRRIFELYLNLIEWGDGIYGAEAAAQRHFGVSAADLDARQAALLAAVIINPRRYSAEQPGPRIERRMRMILSRMRGRGLLTENEYRVALGQAPPSGFFDWLFGPKPDTTRTEAPAPPDTMPLEPAIEDTLPGE